ncbi:MAG: choline dehydrogenase-like flavoprotein [Paraglaciecola sp.]|jgi:choline dehydrogenase-like flavoprotein|uniref:GMC family oxidoreductase n=1 Tax=uncultured Paraglaciecola sp. TaxID=1765024 RepID=UPI00260019E9|nr:choline dehydrogenase [uncultured Paraglaciecola sp.]
MQKLSQTQFDFIIIGAGSAGATLAARLTENNQFSVCLIEAGGKDTSPFIHIPFGLAFLSRMTNLGWEYDTEPQSQLNDRSLFWPRGKVLGGSSSLNAMCYIRGVPEDYDRWNDMGAKGWDWQTVLPYFKKSEKQQHGESEMHGADGYLSVSDLRHTNPLSSTFVDAAEQIGLSKVTDFNGPDREGLGFYQVTQENGQRCSTAKGYLTPALTRSNLTLLTKALVEKIQIIDGVATGVKLQLDGQSIELTANKEVLLSAGAINSPQILMLSGVGPKEHLAENGIKVKVDLPGVGQNLQDHLDIIVQHHCKNRDSYSISLALIPRYIKNTFNYLFNRQGIFTSNVAEAGGFDKTQYAADIPDIQYHFLPAILLDHGRTTAFGYGFGVHVCGLYPKSRGEIRLRSNKPNTPAVIDPHYLEHLDDQKVMIDGVRRARKILAAASFDKYESWEVGPGPDAQTDEEILAFIRKNSETIYHPIGTCKMGDISDVMTVVDSQLKVKDIKGLRVVDASVMPSLVGGNTNAPTIMIAERCADLIKQEHK